MGMINRLDNLKNIERDKIITEDSFTRTNLSNLFQDELANANTFKTLAFYFDIFKTGENLVLLMLILDQDGNYKLTKTYDDDMLEVFLGKNHYLSTIHFVSIQQDYIKNKLANKTFNSFNKFEDNDLTYLNIIQKKVNTIKSKNIDKALKYVVKRYSVLSHVIDSKNNLDELIKNADKGKINFK